MRRIAFPFWNRHERRLRAGWRILLQLALFVVALVAFTLVGRRLVSGPAGTALGSAVYLVLAVGFTWLLARFVDRRRFAEYGFHLSARAWIDLGFGFALGAGLMTAIFLVEILAGWVELETRAVTKSGLSPLPALLLSVFAFAVVAVNEELTFRGYQLRNLAEGLAGRRIDPRAAIVAAWAISSLVFGLAHLSNAGSTLVSALNIFLVTALLVGLPYVLTGELAIPIGIHLSWNLFQGTVFGLPVSGTETPEALLAVTQHGPPLWTGGAFGPEGGLLATLSSVVGCGLVLLWIRTRHGRIALHDALARYRRPSEATVEPDAA